MRPVKKIGLWGVTRFLQLRGIPLLGGYGGSAEGLWSAYSNIKGEALVQIPTQRQPLPIERDKPVRALFMKFHFIPPDNHLNNDYGEMSLHEWATIVRISSFSAPLILWYKEWKSSFLKALKTAPWKTPANKSRIQHKQKCLVQRMPPLSTLTITSPFVLHKTSDRSNTKWYFSLWHHLLLCIIFLRNVKI